MTHVPDPLHSCRPGGSCSTCNAPDEEARLCTACNASPATEPAHRLSRAPRYCRSCVEVMRDDARDALDEARADERFEYGNPEYDEDPS